MPSQTLRRSRPHSTPKLLSRRRVSHSKPRNRHSRRFRSFKPPLLLCRLLLSPLRKALNRPGAARRVALVARPPVLCFNIRTLVDEPPVPPAAEVHGDERFSNHCSRDRRRCFSSRGVGLVP